MTLATPMYYGERTPAEELRPWVAAFWHFRVVPDAGTIRHHVPPDGGTSLFHRNRLGGLMLRGPGTDALITDVQGGDVFWGARFWPGAVSALLPVRSAAIGERALPLSEVERGDWGTSLARDLEAARSETEAADIWTEALRRRVIAARPLDAAVMTAVFAIIASQGRIDIAGLARRARLSPRQFRRRFRAAVGLSAKELARVRRLRASLVDSLEDDPEPWVALATAHGYSDQAHLVREYRRLVGLPPRALREYLSRIEHGRVVDR